MERSTTFMHELFGKDVTEDDLAAAEGDDRRAARLWGARLALIDATGAQVTSHVERRSGFTANTEEALRRLGAEAEGLVLEGRAMDREQAVAYALEAVATPA
ncbi:MAG: hypothetical protein ACRDGT_06135 [Candidatus Limnocylindria bacterium]